MNFLKKLVQTITGQVKSDSEGGKINSVDVHKTIRDGIFVMLAAGVTYLSQKVPSFDLGPYSEALIPVITMVLAGAMRFLRDNSTEVK